MAAECCVEVDARVETMEDAAAVEALFAGLRVRDPECRLEVRGGINRATDGAGGGDGGIVSAGAAACGGDRFEPGGGFNGGRVGWELYGGAGGGDAGWDGGRRGGGACGA